MITVERVRELLSYDPDTGIMRWKVARGRVAAGSVAGFDEKGYRGIRVDGVQTYIHRVAFLHFYGYAPNVVDHLNGDKSDNRIANLRDVDVSLNLRNRARSSNNRSGVTGVFWNSEKRRWTARIKVRGRTIHLGDYLDKKDAAEARKAAERKMDFTERHGTIPEDRFAFVPRETKAA